MMTRISNHNESNESTHNNNNANVRKHRSLINLNSPFPSSIPRRSNSIDRNKPSKNIISSFGSPTSMKNEKRNKKERRHRSLSYLSEPIAGLKTNNNFEKQLMDNTSSTTSLFYQFEKENKKNDLEDIKGKETKSKYSAEAVDLLLMENEKKVKSLNDESANYLLNKYTNSLLKESIEKNLSEIKSTPTALSLSPSTSQLSSVNLDFNKTNDNSQSSKKIYQFITGDSKSPSSTTKSNSISFNSNDSSKTKNSLTNHHSISHLKYPMSYQKKKSIPSSEFTQNSKEYDDFEDDDLSFRINSDDDDEIKIQQQNEMLKELDEDIKILELLPQSIKIKTVNKENDINNIPIINSSHPSSIPILSNSKHSNEKSINNISSSSTFSSVYPKSTFLQNTKKSNTEAFKEPSTKSSSSLMFNPSKEDTSNSSNKPTTFNDMESINKRENSIDDKTILNTFTVVFDNISSLTTKIDLLTEIMDKNEEKQQQQYNLDMNQINFELFEIKQKVGQSMKKLQQEITPILQALKEKNKKEKDENKIKFDEKKTVQPSLLSEKEKAEILLEQEAIKTKNEYLEQNLSIMRSKIKNFSKENQILKKKFRYYIN